MVSPIIKKNQLRPIYQTKECAYPFICEAEMLGEDDFKNRDHVLAVAESN